LLLFSNNVVNADGVSVLALLYVTVSFSGMLFAVLIKLLKKIIFHTQKTSAT